MCHQRIQVQSHCCWLESNTCGLSPKSLTPFPLGYSVQHMKCMDIFGDISTSGFAAGGLPCHSSTATVAAVVGRCNCNCSCRCCRADWSRLSSRHEIYQACSPARGHSSWVWATAPTFLGVQQPSVITGQSVS
jgi:hypothetical protein